MFVDGGEKNWTHVTLFTFLPGFSWSYLFLFVIFEVGCKYNCIHDYLIETVFVYLVITVSLYLVVNSNFKIQKKLWKTKITMSDLIMKKKEKMVKT